MWAPIVLTGVKEFCAPCGTSAIFFQRRRRSDSSSSARRFRPAKMTEPAATLPAGKSPSAAMTILVLPLPDSPTRPTKAPRGTSNDTPETAS